MKAVTIDQLQLKDHVRWAEDQQGLDLSLIAESQLVASHPEVMGLSAIYSSQFDILFDLHHRNAPWAFFEPPRNFHRFNKRFFSHRLFAHSDEEEATAKEELTHVLTSHSLFEKDKTTLLRLLEEIAGINVLLMRINGRRLQYQKG